MNTNFFGWARAVFNAALALVLTSSMLDAIDRNNRFFAYGVGHRSCEDYVKFRERRLETLQQEYPRYTKDELYDIVNRIIEQWIAGFITAHNLYVSDTYDIAGKSNMDDLKGRLEKICRANPNQRFAEAIIAVVEQLNTQRVKASGGK